MEGIYVNALLCTGFRLWMWSSEPVLSLVNKHCFLPKRLSIAPFVSLHLWELQQWFLPLWLLQYLFSLWQQRMVANSTWILSFPTHLASLSIHKGSAFSEVRRRSQLERKAFLQELGMFQRLHWSALFSSNNSGFFWNTRSCGSAIHIFMGMQ